MVKAPEGMTDTNTADIDIELPTRTLGQGVTITSQGTMGGTTCYSSDSVANISTCITKWVCSFLRLSAVGAEVRAKQIKKNPHHFSRGRAVLFF